MNNIMQFGQVSSTAVAMDEGALREKANEINVAKVVIIVFKCLTKMECFSIR